MPGFSVGKKERKMGIRCSPTVALHFTDCSVPATQRLGEEGEGFKIAMRTLDMTAADDGAMAVGIGQAALDAAPPTRRSGSSSASRSPRSRASSSCSDMAMQVPRARLMVHHAARQVDAGILGNTFEASMAKCWGR